MSVSTLDSPASVRALDRMAAQQDEQAEQEAFAAEEISQAFAQLGKCPAKLIAVPYAVFSNGSDVRWMPMSAAITDLISDSYGVEELIAALEQSPCPHVAAIRQAMCDRWIKNHAADIAEARL